MNSPPRRPAAPAATLAAAFAITVSLSLAMLPAARADADPPGLTAVATLAEINGQALACQDMAAMRRAKALMLAHAPRSSRYGSAFEDGTQRAFLAVTRAGGDCPGAEALAQRLDGVARQLQTELPASAASQP